MSAENEHINPNALSIVPSLSLNKHISALHNYSIHNAINMRMSNDRTTIQNIEALENHKTIMDFLRDTYDNNYKILFILPCNNELVLFVLNKNLYNGSDFTIGRKCVELVRYNENTNTIKVVYSAITYYGGKFVGTYTYNYDNYLIISFCEYHKDFTNNYANCMKTITLGNDGDNDYNTLNCDEKLFYNEPEIVIPKINSITKTKGKGCFGWQFFYIRFKINNYDYTRWIYIGSPILLESKNYTTIFRNLHTDASSAEDEYLNSIKTITLDSSNYIDVTATLNVDFTDINLYKKYQFGLLVISKDSVRKFRTDDLEVINDNINYIFDLNNFIEEDLNFNNNYNYYNVKNIINYKNRLYVSNYKEDNILKEYNTNNIKLSLNEFSPYNNYRDYYNFGNIVVPNEVLYDNNHIINPLIYIGSEYNPPAFTNITQMCKIRGVHTYMQGSEIQNDIIEVDVDITRVEYVIDRQDLITDGRTIQQAPILKVRFSVYDEQQQQYVSYELTNLIVSSFSPTLSGAYEPLRIFSENNDLLLSADYQSYYYDNNIIHLDETSLHYYDANNLLYFASNVDYHNLKEETYITTLAVGEIYKFYIHFVDKFGNLTKGFPIYNNKKLYLNGHTDETDDEYTIFINSQQIVPDSTTMQGKYIPKMYAISTRCTFEDIKEDARELGSNIIYEVTNINSINDDYDTFEGTLIQSSQFNTLVEKFYSYQHAYDIGDDRGYLNKSFGLYINSAGERLFYVPYMESKNVSYGLHVKNVTIPDGYIGYYISVKKPFTRQDFIGFTNGDYYYSDDINIELRKPSFDVFRIFKEANDNGDNRLTELLAMSKVGDRFNNPLNIDYKNSKDTQTLRFAGDPSKDREDRSTVIGEINQFDVIKAGVGINTSNNIYLDKKADLSIIGNINYNSETDILNSLPGHDFYSTAIIYDETKGFKVNQAGTSGNVNSIPKCLEIITKSNKYITRKIKNTPNIMAGVGDLASVYVLPVNSIDLYENAICNRFENDINFQEEFDENQKYISIFNNKIIFSNVINDENIEEKWRKFDAESYKLISENKGNIVNLFVLGESMFVHCEQAIYLLEFKDYLATNEQSLQITQSSIKDISYKEILPTDKGYAGLQDKDASIIGIFGYIFYENDTNRILRLDNGRLIYMDYPIQQWLQKYKPYKVRFANDIERNNLLIQFNYLVDNEEKRLILLYDYTINSFVSILDNNTFWFDEAYNTKNKLYLVRHDNENYSKIKCFNDYKFEKHTFDILTQNNETIQLTNKLSFVYNANYNAVKYIDSIMFKLFKYINNENPNEYNCNDFTYDPIENIRIPFCGDYIRIYNENVDTGWINIKEAQDKNNYNTKDAYELPHYNLGNWNMNMFRNIIDKKQNSNYSKINRIDYVSADDRARLYGNYFIIEFGFNTNDEKYIGETSDKFEFQSLLVNANLSL